MKSLVSLRASFQNTLVRLTGVWIIAALLAGAAFSTQPVGKALAATCTSKNDGDWNSASNWDCGHVPTSADDVFIDNTFTTGVTLSSDQSVHNLTINPFGILVVNSAMTLSISGNFSIDATGLFDPGSDAAGSTVVFGPGSQTITTNGVMVDFWNLTKNASGTAESLSVDPPVSGVGGIHIANNLSLKGTSSNNLLLRSTDEATQWQIDPSGPRDVDYVDVQDSNNVNAAVILVAHGVDSGNNTGWAFTTTSVVLTSDENPSRFGDAVLFTATINTPAATGTVTFKDGGVDIVGCETPSIVVDGVAGCYAAALAVGSHTITAAYSGDDTYLSSDSNPLQQFVVNAIIFMPLLEKQ
jgi:hypothetical protein